MFSDIINRKILLTDIGTARHKIKYLITLQKKLGILRKKIITLFFCVSVNIAAVFEYVNNKI